MRMLRRVLMRINGLLIGRAGDQRLREEVEQHIALLTEDNIRAGLSPREARRKAVLTFGSVDATMEAYRDQRSLPLLEALISDVAFGWRQLNKHRTSTVAAILSLGLAIGATTAAFRLVDAVLLRPLAVAEPGRLLHLAHTYLDAEGQPAYDDYYDYPTYRRYREIAGERAELMVVGMNARQDVFVGSAGEPEKFYRQYLSGNVFGVFGLQPAIGRLITANDDLKPGGHPIAVLSYDCWSRRFNRRSSVLGTVLRIGSSQYEVVGVAPEGFTGTEPGQVTDVFIPAVMNVAALDSPGWSWFRIWVRPNGGFSPDQVREPLQAAFTGERQQAIKGFHSDTPKQQIEATLRQQILLLPAAAGVSALQKDYRRPLLILSFLVVLVLLVACVNIANLLNAQAAARGREMALRVSIGAGRGRLVQLMLVQSVLLAAAASALGLGFSTWAAPAVTSMLQMPDVPVRLILETGWRELAFTGVLTLVVTLLFGLAPAYRASAVHPISALKGTGDTRSRHRLMNGLLAAQVSFCVLVLFLAGLFLGTFRQLASRPLGFVPERVLIMDVSARSRTEPAVWRQVADHLQTMPGVTSASMAAWSLLSENRWTASVRLPNRPVDPRPSNFLEVAQGFFETLRITQIDGRDFRPGDVQPRLDQSGQLVSGVGIVNEAFARKYFGGVNPVGKWVEVRQAKDWSAAMEIVGYVRDAVYRNLREPMPPTVYVPMGPRRHNAFLVRTDREPLSLAQALRSQIRRARPDLRVESIEPHIGLVHRHLLRERLLGTLSGFFAVVALVLAAVGLYGVLNYSITRQRREIGIRIALGARAAHVLRKVTFEVAVMIGLGSAAGVAAGAMSARFIEVLLYGVKATDIEMIGAPIATLACIAVVAAIPPALRATRIDPARTLRCE